MIDTDQDNPWPGPEGDSNDGEHPVYVQVLKEEWERVQAERDESMKQELHLTEQSFEMQAQPTLAEEHYNRMMEIYIREHVKRHNRKIDLLQAQLAQAREVLEAVLDVLKWNDVDEGIGPTGIGNRIRAALAAMEEKP